MTRILIADDHAIVRQGVRNLIETHAGWSVCGEAGDGLTGLSMAASLSPDLAVVDVALPGMSGLALVRRFRETWPGLRTLLFSFIDDEETIASGRRRRKRLRSQVGRKRSSRGRDRGHRRRRHLYFRSDPGEGENRPVGPARWSGKLSTPRELEVLRLAAEGKATSRSHTCCISASRRSRSIGRRR